MDRTEFGKVLAFLTAGIGIELSDAATEVYFECLADIDYNRMYAAAIVVINEHVWHTFPSIAELRQAATTLSRGEICDLTAAEAWEMAWRAASAIDLEMTGLYRAKDDSGVWQSWDSQKAFVCRDLPNIVQEAMRAFGISAMVAGEEPVGVVRAQFTKIYEQLAGRDQRKALLPGVASKLLGGRIGATMVKIGRE